MSLPKVETVNVVTMEHGRTFAQGWFDGHIEDACEGAEIMTWPELDRHQQASFLDLQDDICGRVFEAIKEHVAETFVRIANAAIEEERVRPEEPLEPPRIETVELVTPEHGLMFAELMHERLLDTEHFSEAFGRTDVMTWPDAEENEYSDAQKHFHELTSKIRDRLHEETKQAIAEAFVRVVSDVISRERGR